jgi:cytochrome P450
MTARRESTYDGRVLPPGSRAPAIWQIVRWIAQPLTFLDENHRRYGDVFTLRAPRDGNFIVVSRPELIKQVLAADPDVLLAGVSNMTLLEPMLGRYSVLTLDGREHLRQRRLLLPAFHGERMQAFAA